MDDRQRSIYTGLMSIGEEIAAFYNDALSILDSDLKSKSYLIAHLAREIDGGLRDVFYVNEGIQPDICPVCNQEISTNLCPSCGQIMKPKNRHKESILGVLGVNKETELAKLWHKTTKDFHKYAHRHGAYKQPRTGEDIEYLWSSFEKVLYKIIGNYYNIENRIEQILKLDKPTKSILNTLPNLLKQPARNAYFFKNLTSPNWLKPLFDKGFFSGENNPYPVEKGDSPGYYMFPQWPALNYLEKVSERNLIEENEKATKLIVQIIDDIIEFKDSNGKRIDNPYTNYSILKIISHLPLKYIKDRYFAFYRSSIDTKWNSSLLFSDIPELFLTRFIGQGNCDLTLKILNVILEFKESDIGFEGVNSIIENLWLKKYFDGFKQGMIKTCRLKIIDTVLPFIKRAMSLNDFLFSTIDIKSIKDEPRDYHIDNYTKQLTFLVRDTCITLDPEDCFDVITRFINENHSLFQRLALYVISEKYHQLKDIFWKWKNNPIEDSTFYKPELYRLFQAHAKEFNEEEIKKIVSWIEKTEFWISSYEEDMDDKTKKTIIAYGRKEFYSALLDSGNKRIQEKYDYYNKINQAEIDHPGQNFVIETAWGDPSPLGKDEIKKLGLKKLIDFYGEFKENPYEFNGPTLTGLSNAIIESIKESPEAYTSHIDILLQSITSFKKIWIRGLCEAWKSGKNFGVKNVFKLINQIIAQSEFWKKNNIVDSANEENRFVYEVTRFISIGCENDKNAFNENDLLIVKDTLLTIIENDLQPASGFKELSMQSLNTSVGYSYIALIQYSLKWARLLKNKNPDSNDLWNKDIVNIINKKLAKTSGSPLFYFTLGQFLPNLFFISKRWTKKNFSKIFDGYNTYSKAALLGYFMYHKKASNEIFNLFHSKIRLYEKLALNFDEENKRVQWNIINHILFGYSYKWIDVKDVLIQELIHNHIEKYQFYIINFYWSPRKRLPNSVIPQIKPLWGEILYVVKQDINNKTYVNIISGMSKWINWLDTIDDDIYEWLKFSFEYLTSSDRYSIVEILYKHVKKTPEKVAVLLLLMYRKKVEYSLSKDILNSIIESLYKTGFKEKADEICLLHAKNGIDYLKNTYKKFNPEN